MSKKEEKKTAVEGDRHSITSEMRRQFDCEKLLIATHTIAPEMEPKVKKTRVACAVRDMPRNKGQKKS